MTPRDRTPLDVFTYDSREGTPFDFLEMDPSILSRPERTLVYRAHQYLTVSLPNSNHADVQELGYRVCEDLDKLIVPNTEDIAVEVNDAVLKLAAELDDEIVRLQIDGHSEKVIKLITSRFSVELDPTETKPEDLKLARAICRQGIFIYIQKALKSQYRISYSAV